MMHGAGKVIRSEAERGKERRMNQNGEKNEK